MNIAVLMEEIGEKLGAIEKLRVHTTPPRSISAVPAAVVGYPDSYNYDTTMRRGHDSLTLPVYVVVGQVDSRTSRDIVARYTDGSGDFSIKAVLEAAEWTEPDEVTVTSCEFSTISVGTADYLAATFTLSVIGTGS